MRKVGSVRPKPSRWAPPNVAHEAPSQPHPVAPTVLAGIDRMLAMDPPATQDLPYRGPDRAQIGGCLGPY
ncbi:hypothetical protein CBM2623_U50015 [Cupriavidus taiwanensis]|nr:hypothetical protein CBM2588_A80087 [Cupriavidus taiwanensis]SOY80122.1 hypothetical protein CBM2591_A130005 [Cupriavidus taiwanensis]SOZ33759.1 hypothetical protein CBM2608_U60005 [Cupriavidus taiwanensis]SOZ50922.1 hypothetical protein CBM2617_A110081 [Cupriavidus taiwanensis]SOZ76020.1 hypothetical protein CBM2622_A110079 [Cupriavidus taiwanensis]